MKDKGEQRNQHTANDVGKVHEQRGLAAAGCEAVYRSEKIARHGRFEVISPKMCIWFSTQVTSQATRE
jgi:hypothetical protein